MSKRTQLLSGKPCRKNPTVFAIAVLVATGLFWLYMLLTRCANLSSYFVKDLGDTSMDYFHMLSNIYNGDPYYAYANYPALCFVFFRIMYRFLPTPIPEEYGDGFYLRNHMVAQLGYIMFLLFCLFVILIVIQSISTGTTAQKNLFCLAILFSGPMVFTLERGNILLLSLAFLALFLLLYDSEKFSLRVLAYLALSVAAAIKIYPAVFGLLVLWKKRYKESVLLLIMGAATFFLPFFCFNGLESLQMMLKGILLSSANMAGLGLGQDYSFSNLFLLFATLLGGDPFIVPGWVNIVAFLLCAFFFWISDSEWKKLYVLALFCIWIPRFAYTYVLVLMFLPILSFFFRDTSHGRFDAVYSVLFWLMIIPLSTPLIDRINQLAGNLFPVSFGTFIVYFALIGVLVFIFVEWLQKISIHPLSWFRETFVSNKNNIK